MSSKTLGKGIPAGIVIDYAADAVPSGFLLCDGSAVSRTTYSRLFSIIGTTYGVGDGSSTFNLPDCRSRISIGAGQGSGLTNRTLGQTGGEESHQLTEAELPSHTHVQDSHNHWFNSFDPNVDGTYGTDNTPGRTSNLAPLAVHDNSSSTTAVNQSTGENQSHNNMQPYLVCTKIIKF